MKDADLLNVEAYQIASKSDPSSPLTENQIYALKKLAENQGNLEGLPEDVRADLASLQATYSADPNIVGDAVIVDFSVRAFSIHNTWSVFKGSFGDKVTDPLELPRVNLRLSQFVKKG